MRLHPNRITDEVAMNGYYSRELFTNRRIELDKLERAWTSTLSGDPARLAFLGLRRIGKTILFDSFIETKRDAGEHGVAMVDFERILSNPETFSMLYVLGIAGQVLGSPDFARSEHLGLAEALASDLGASAAFRETASHIIQELAKQKPDQSLLFDLALSFPQRLAQELGRELLVFIDEFQEITKLREYRSIGDPLAVFRAILQRHNMVGYVIAGSAMSIMDEMMSSGPLLGMFSRQNLGPFDRDDAAELVRKFAPGIGARDVGKICAYAGGNPFYITALSRTVSELASEEGLDLQDLVDIAFLEEVLGFWGTIYEYCYYLLEVSLERARYSGNLKALLQVLSENTEGVSATEAAKLAHKSPQATRNYLIELCRFDILEREDDLYYFKDPVFKYWMANQRFGVAWSTTPTRSDVRGALARNREALAALADELGPAMESVVRETMGHFDGQELQGNLFGINTAITVPSFDNVEPVHGGTVGELEAVGTGTETWACEVKWRRSAAGEHEMTELIRRAGELDANRAWFVSKSGFTREAIELAQREGVLFSDRNQFRQIKELVEG